MHDVLPTMNLDDWTIQERARQLTWGILSLNFTEPQLPFASSVSMKQHAELPEMRSTSL